MDKSDDVSYLSGNNDSKQSASGSSMPKLKSVTEVSPWLGASCESLDQGQQAPPVQQRGPPAFASEDCVLGDVSDDEDDGETIADALSTICGVSIECAYVDVELNLTPSCAVVCRDVQSVTATRARITQLRSFAGRSPSATQSISDSTADNDAAQASLQAVEALEHLLVPQLHSLAESVVKLKYKAESRAHIPDSALIGTLRQVAGNAAVASRVKRRSHLAGPLPDGASVLSSSPITGAGLGSSSDIDTIMGIAMHLKHRNAHKQSAAQRIGRR